MQRKKSNSQKGLVIERLYDTIYLAEARATPTMLEVIGAIEYCNQHHDLNLSTRNVANFMKDWVRGENANLHWPQRLKDARISGRQRVREGRVLEFIRYAPGQGEPFESVLKMSPGLVPVPIQSIGIPLTAKSLGRTDESWLIQVAVTLKIIETHFAIRERSPALNVLEMVHLQTGVKLGSSEIDGIFLATVELGGSQAKALVTCEAKQTNERILDHQIVGQAVAANKSVKARGLEIDVLIPIALKALKEPAGAVYVVECEEWTPAEAEMEEADLKELLRVSEGLYQLRPPVPGIGMKPRKPKALSKTKRKAE